MPTKPVDWYSTTPPLAPVPVKLLDTHNGRVVEVGDICRYSWQEGNWSCDCNRDGYFDRAEAADGAGSHPDDEEACAGCHRYVVVWADAPGFDPNEWNQEYPAGTVAHAMRMARDRGIIKA